MPKKILLVEDDPLSMEFMRIFLEDNSYTVLCADSLETAVAVCERDRPSVIVTDIDLGASCGIDIAARARKLGATKVVGITGYDRSQLESMGRDCSEFDGILTKPVILQSLLKLIVS